MTEPDWYDAQPDSCQFPVTLPCAGRVLIRAYDLGVGVEVVAYDGCNRIELCDTDHDLAAKEAEEAFGRW